MGERHRPVSRAGPRPACHSRRCERHGPLRGPSRRGRSSDPALDPAERRSRDSRDWRGQGPPGRRARARADRFSHHPAAEATGLEPGTPVVAGSADHVASAFAAGLVRDGDLLVKLGGAGDILLATAHPLIDRRLYLDFHPAPGLYLPNGCMAASGSFIRWFQARMASGVPLSRLDEEAEASTPGASGVVALPYMLGEKTPIHDPDARGAFIGLSLATERGDLFRAVLESIAFGFRHHLDVLAELGHEPRRVRVTNGGRDRVSGNRRRQMCSVSRSKR